MQKRNLLFIRKIIIRLIALLAMMPNFVYAQVTPPTPPSPPTNSGGMDAVQMLVNLSSTYPALWQMVTGLCYIVGFALTIRAIYYLKAYGELRTMTATTSSIKVPVIYFIAASALIFIPSTFKTINLTLFGSSSPLAYNQVNSSMNPVIMAALVGLVQLVGLVAFVRGWMILVANAQQSSGQASFGKALTHIIGGVLAINVLGLMDVIWNTFGFNFGF